MSYVLSIILSPPNSASRYYYYHPPRGWEKGGTERVNSFSKVREEVVGSDSERCSLASESVFMTSMLHRIRKTKPLSWG